MLLQPNSSPISTEQLAAEVKGIYAGLVMVEAKCIDIDAAQGANQKCALGAKQWQALIALHRILLYEHHDLLMSQTFARHRRNPFAVFAQQRHLATIYKASGIGDGSLMQALWAPLDGLLEDAVETGKDVHTTSKMIGDLVVAAADQTPEPGHVPLAMAQNAKVPRDCIAIGLLKGTCVEALADSCAGNLISDAYLRLQGLAYKTGQSRGIVVDNGQRAFSTLGAIRLPWKFQKEEHTEYYIDFDVIPARFCSHAVTLGGKFLSATRTLAERFKDRIFRKPRQSVLPRLLYQGASRLRVKAYCEGVRVAALADTCSDLDLLSPEMLVELGYEQHDILTDDEHRVFLELPGGLITRASGMVRDVEIRFGDGRAGDSYIRNFYILPGLPAGVLIGNDFLWQSDAFSKYSEHLIDIDDEDLLEDVPEGMFLNIKLVKQRKSWWSRLRGHAVGNADAEALIQWQTQCKGVLDEIEAVHYKDIPLDARNDEILKLEQKYRGLVQKPPTPVASASGIRKQRRVPASLNSRAMVQACNSAGHVSSTVKSRVPATGTANT